MGEIQVSCAEWLSPNDFVHESTVQVADHVSMGELEILCQEILKCKNVNVKEGLLTYNRHVKPDYNKKSLATWVLHEDMVLNYLYTKIEDKVVNYTPITKYTFYDNNDQWVKVLLDLQGIGSIDKENLKGEFLPRSFAFKIHGYEGKDLIFRVPKLHFKINPDKCKWILKPNKIIISLCKYK